MDAYAAGSPESSDADTDEDIKHVRIDVGM